MIKRARRAVAALFVAVMIVKDKNIASGSATNERVFSEYWTFIRSAATRGATRTEKKCPSCGGPLQINMAGGCAHCGAKVASGQFDWVLSRIEQDDTYAG